MTMIDYDEEKKKRQIRSDNIYMAGAAVLIVSILSATMYLHKLKVHEELAVIQHERAVERLTLEVELQTLLNQGATK